MPPPPHIDIRLMPNGHIFVGLLLCGQLILADRRGTKKDKTREKTTLGSSKETLKKKHADINSGYKTQSRLKSAHF